MMSSTPSASAIATIRQKMNFASVAQKIISRSNRPSPKPALMRCCMLNRTGEPETKPCNFANATMEPVNVIAPIITPRLISIRLPKWISPERPIPYASGDHSAAIAIITAANPTSEWNAATSCGIAVIAILRAMPVPIAPPSAMPPKIQL